MKKIVSLEMDKVRNLKFGINSLIELEKRLGKALTSLAQEAFSLSDFRTILFVGLKWEDKELTEEKTGELMDLAIGNNGIQYISEKVAEAMQSVFGGQVASPIPS